MLNVVFRRMEHFAQLLQEKRAGHSKLKGKSLRNGIREKEEPQREDSQDTTTAVVKEIIHSLVAKVAAEQEPKRGSNATREDESAKQDKDSIERQIGTRPFPFSVFKFVQIARRSSSDSSLLCLGVWYDRARKMFRSRYRHESIFERASQL